MDPAVASEVRHQGIHQSQQFSVYVMYFNYLSGTISNPDQLENKYHEQTSLLCPKQQYKRRNEGQLSRDCTAVAAIVAVVAAAAALDGGGHGGGGREWRWCCWSQYYIGGAGAAAAGVHSDGGVLVLLYLLTIAMAIVWATMLLPSMTIMLEVF